MRRILRSLVQKMQSKQSPAPRSTPAMIEGLEDRRLMSITVSSIVADNRGQVYVNLNPNGGTINKSTITKSSVILYTAGADGAFGTADDVRMTENITFNTNINRIVVTTKVAPGVGYRLRLVASRIMTTNNQILDGEFSGTYPTGNGSPGGDFNALTKIDKSLTPTVRMVTSYGSVAITLYGDTVPDEVNYFVNEANHGFYDNLIFNRSEPTGQGFSIMETGIIRVGSDNTFYVNDPGNGRTPENVPSVHNTRSTIAMSRYALNTALEGTGFLFNMEDNHGVTIPFGNVVSGFDVLQTINALPTIDLTTDPDYHFTLANTSKLPVNSNTVTPQTWQHYSDSVVIRRTAIQMRVVRMT